MPNIRKHISENIMDMILIHGINEQTRRKSRNQVNLSYTKIEVNLGMITFNNIGSLIWPFHLYCTNIPLGLLDIDKKRNVEALTDSVALDLYCLNFSIRSHLPDIDIVKGMIEPLPDSVAYYHYYLNFPIGDSI